MAEAVVSVVLEKLSDFMIKEVTFLSEVGDQVELAQTELQVMQSFLKDADARQGDDASVRLLVASVRDAAYDFEDVIDTFSVKVIFKRNHRNLLQRCAGIFKKGFHLHMIGSELEKITTKISTLKLSLQSFNIKELQQGSGAATASFESQQHQRRIYPHVKEREVVGLEGDADSLAAYLVRQEKRHLVVSIWGMGGSGKTTLAKHVYDRHNDVRHYFECFAWVYVSQDSQRCQGRDVLEEILIQLVSPTDKGRPEMANMKRDDIVRILYSIQIKFKCLVVLDDIWNTNAWESLKAGFPTNVETGSRILLTTRHKDVALHVDPYCFLHESRLLNDQTSWELFAKIAISRTAEPNSETYAMKKELGKEMLQQCAGLPLAIIVLAELLARKKTTEEWDIVHKNVDVYIRRGTNLEREYKGQEYKGTSWVLALSYDNLPYRLKLCFLYLGHFPELSVIPVKRLTQLWMAEGLISPTSEEMMEDVAYNCLSELVERCMVQVGNYGSTNKIKTCRLHDLMRDLCVLKAKEENFLHIVNFSSKAVPIGKVRRLAIYLNREVSKSALKIDGRHVHLRSLLYFGEPNLNEKLIQPTFKNFKFLRVLKFEDMVIQVKLPSTIGNLVHLRFLSLKNSNIKELPSSVANLVCLQTLDLRCCSVWEKIPNVFGKMEQLRHLYLPSEHKTSEKLSFGAVHSLRTLVNVSWGQCGFAELTNLRKLFIEVSDSESSQNTVEMLKSTSITSLSVKSCGTNILGKIVSSCHDIIKLRVVGPIGDVLEDLPNYPNLRKLTLEITRLKQRQIDVLEKLPKIRTLCLTDAFGSGNSRKLVFSEGGFLHLEFLSLKWLDELEEWIVEKGAMPSLCRLHIERCHGLRTFPDGLQYVTTLNELTIKDMPPSFCYRLQEGEEDFYKIQHVASVTLDTAFHEYVKIAIEKKIQIALYVQRAALQFIEESDYQCNHDATDPIDQHS